MDPSQTNPITHNQAMYSAIMEGSHSSTSIGSGDSHSSNMEKALVQEPEWKPGKQEYAVMLTLAVISLMVALDATILVSVLPTLAVDLQGTATDAFWAGTSYLLTCAVCQPFIAALSDIFGRKEMLLVSIVLFTLGTIICAPVAKTFAVLFVGRSIQGIGGGGIITMGQVIFADIVPLRQRPKYFSLVMAAWALGSVLGPFVGGLFVEHATWGWCFYINLPFCAIGLVLVPIYVKLSTAKSSLVSKLGRVDWIGGFFFIGGLTSFLIGISWAGVQYAWNSAATIAPMVVGVVSIVIAIFWEIYGAQEPFLRPSLFHSASAIATYSCALFQGFILFCALYYLPFYFTAIKFASPTITGLNIFPITFFLLPGSIVISLITTRIGRYRWAIWMGWAITAVSGGLLVLLDESTPTRIWAVIFAVFGIGNGMVLTSVNIGVQAVSRVEDAARAAAMYAFMRTLGMSLGVAVGGTVFQNVMSSKLHELGLPEEISHNSEAFVQVMAALSPTDPVRTGAILAYIAGFHGVYWALTSAAIASFFISLIIKRHSMDKSLESSYTLRGSQNPSRPAIKAGPSPTASQDWNTPPGAVNYNGYAHPETFPAAHTYTAPSTMPMAPQEQNLVGGTHPTISQAEEPITAYYIQPGGRIVPVNILPENQQGGEISGMPLGNHGYDARYGNSV